MEPEVLLLDEVLSVGDVAFQERVSEKIRSASSAGTATVLVSHNLGFVRSFCRRVLTLEKGELIFDGKADAAIAAYTHSIATKRRFERVLDASLMDPEAAHVVTCDFAGDGTYAIDECKRLRIGCALGAGVSAAEPFVVLRGLDSALELSFFGRDAQPSFRLEAGQTRVVQIEIAAGLRPGRYVVDAGLISPSGKVLDWNAGIAYFDTLPAFVDGRPFDSRVGYVFPECTWSFED